MGLFFFFATLWNYFALLVEFSIFLEKDCSVFQKEVPLDKPAPLLCACFILLVSFQFPPRSTFFKTFSSGIFELFDFFSFSQKLSAQI